MNDEYNKKHIHVQYTITREKSGSIVKKKEKKKKERRRRHEKKREKGEEVLFDIKTVIYSHYYYYFIITRRGLNWEKNQSIVIGNNADFQGENTHFFLTGHLPDCDSNQMDLKQRHQA